MDEAFHNRYNARLDLAVALARLSPAFVFKKAAVLLAGTGVDRHRGFFTAYKQHRRRHIYEFFFGIQNRDAFRKAYPAKYGEYKWDVSDMPRFSYRETWPEAEMRSAMVDIGLLALWGLVFFAGAYAAILRYDLR